MYKINGVELGLQPTSGRWMIRTLKGISGDGHPIYSGVREFELNWNLPTPSDFNVLQAYFNAVGNTGTVVFDLPQYGSSSYTFYSYSGCVLQEPEMAEYFSENHTNVKLIITNIRT